jgi:hypothetical protein
MAFSARVTTEELSLNNKEMHPVYMDTAGNVLVKQGTTLAGEDVLNDVMKVEQRATLTYQAAAATDVVIKAAPGFLYGITVGKEVASGIIEVSDHASDGDGNVVFYLEEAAVGYYPVNAIFAVGISADITTQTNVMFHWR